jgi:hypothetical protein
MSHRPPPDPGPHAERRAEERARARITDATPAAPPTFDELERYRALTELHLRTRRRRLAAALEAVVLGVVLGAAWAWALDGLRWQLLAAVAATVLLLFGTAIDLRKRAEDQGGAR